MTGVGKIIDASALVAILFEEEGHERVARDLSGSNMIAPDLLPYEVANVCLKKCRRVPAGAQDLLFRLEALRRAQIVYIATDPVATTILARRHGLSAYDASYLLLANHLSMDLVTLDQDLRKAADLYLL